MPQAFGQLPSLAAAALVAAWASLPVAGTSLLLMDPYVTTRSFSTPLTLLAVSFAVEACERHRISPGPAAAALLALVAAAAMHPLMSGYGAVLCALIWGFARSRSRFPLALATPVLAVIVAVVVQRTAAVCGTACTLAAHSRDYWFPSQWRWFEWLGLLAPMLFFAGCLRLTQRNRLRPTQRSRLRATLGACLTLGCSALAVALLFCRWNAGRFAVARMQPLRAFLPLYTIFLVALAATAAEWAGNVRGTRAGCC